MAKRKLKLPLGPIPDLLKWWKQTGVRGFVIGGLAVAIHTRARSTKDVDAVVMLDDNAWASFLDASTAFSFLPRYAGTLDFARRSRVFLLYHKPSDTNVDLAIGALGFEEEALRRSRPVKYGRLSIPVASVEDLIVMKTVANREQDRADVVRMLLDYPDVDLAYIRTTLQSFAAILDDPDLADSIDIIRRRLNLPK